jgi:hypothetical protein
MSVCLSGFFEAGWLQGSAAACDDSRLVPRLLLGIKHVLWAADSHAPVAIHNLMMNSTRVLTAACSMTARTVVDSTLIWDTDEPMVYTI